MKTHLGLLLLSVILIGCGEQQTSSPPPAAAEPKPGAAEGTYLGNLADAQKRAVKSVDITSLNSAIQTFQVQEGRNPKDLNELVEKKIMSKLPPPPAQMKFEYNPVDATVKVVPE